MSTPEEAVEHPKPRALRLRHDRFADPFAVNREGRQFSRALASTSPPAEVTVLSGLRDAGRGRRIRRVVAPCGADANRLVVRPVRGIYRTGL
jgi:hypothetical protein